MQKIFCKNIKLFQGKSIKIKETPINPCLLSKKGCIIVSLTAEGYNDATLVAGAFNSVFSWGNIGEKFVAIAMFLFAFTTVLGWSLNGPKAWEYLFGAKATYIFRIIHVCTVIFGAVLTSSLAWDISDTFPYDDPQPYRRYRPLSAGS